VDFRALNKRIVIESVPLPDIHSCFHCFAAATVFITSDLNSAYYQIPLSERSRQCTALATDWNLLGWEKNAREKKTGKLCAYKESDDNGTRLVNFAASVNMAVGSTLFRHKSIHKATLSSPDGATQNQIDHVLIDSKHRSDLVDTRGYTGANIDSDHFVTIAGIQSKFSTVHKRKNTTLNKKNMMLQNCTIQRPQKNLQIQLK
jgi:hypothetical protein